MEPVGIGGEALDGVDQRRGIARRNHRADVVAPDERGGFSFRGGEQDGHAAGHGLEDLRRHDRRERGMVLEADEREIDRCPGLGDSMPRIGTAEVHVGEAPVSGRCLEAGSRGTGSDQVEFDR